MTVIVFTVWFLGFVIFSIINITKYFKLKHAVITSEAKQSGPPVIAGSTRNPIPIVPHIPWDSGSSPE
jgi:hypothetical protein